MPVFCCQQNTFLSADTKVSQVNVSKSELLMFSFSCVHFTVSVTINPLIPLSSVV